MSRPLQDVPVKIVKFGNSDPTENPWIQSNLGARGQMRYHQQNHGDHESAWVLEFDLVGREVARHNVRFLETIIWEVTANDGGIERDS